MCLPSEPNEPAMSADGGRFPLWPSSSYLPVVFGAKGVVSFFSRSLNYSGE